MDDFGTICVIIGAAMLMLMFILYIFTEDKNTDENNSHQGNRERQRLSNRQTQNRVSVNTAPPLPPRKPVSNRTRSSGTIELPRRPINHTPFVNSANAGPHGVRPTEFPCCPIDRQRNNPGMAQLIKWDRENECYVCSRGHKFKSNGKPIYA